MKEQTSVPNCKMLKGNAINTAVFKMSPLRCPGTLTVGYCQPLLLPLGANIMVPVRFHEIQDGSTLLR